MRPFLLVLSAPSGGGKTTIAKNLLQARNDLGYSVSATTRPIRPGEREGVDYHFISRAEFERRRKNGEFLEWATYGGELYGTLKSEIERIFSQGWHAVLDIEIEGARQIRATYPHSLHLFVLPPSAEVLVERLTGRNTENPQLLRKRLIRAADELAAVSEYQYAIVNENLNDALDHVAAILDGAGEPYRVSIQSALPGFVEQLRRDVVKAADKVGAKPRVQGRESRK
ncbi:MAG: guanylate kinase [Gemmatimonadales bacterium]